MSLKSSSIQSDLKTEKKHCLTDWNRNKISMFDWLTLSALSLDKKRLREREIDRVREGESQSLTVLIFLLFSNWLKLFCLRLCFLWHWCLLMARSIYIGKSLKLMQSKGLINRKTLIWTLHKKLMFCFDIFQIGYMFKRQFWINFGSNLKS